MDSSGPHMNRNSQPAPNVLIQHNPLPPSGGPGGPHVLPGMNHPGYTNRPGVPSMGQYGPGNMRGMGMGSPNQPPMLSLQQQVSSSAVMQSAPGGMGMMDSRSMPISSPTGSVGAYSRAGAPSQFRPQAPMPPHSGAMHPTSEGMSGYPPSTSHSEPDPPKSSIASFDPRSCATTGFFSSGPSQAHTQGSAAPPSSISSQPRMTPGMGGPGSTYSGVSSVSNLPTLPPLDETNGVALCRQGKERILELTQKVGEIFRYMTALDLPGTQPGKPNKSMALNALNEHLHYTLMLMERLDKVWSHLESLEREHGQEIKFTEEEFTKFLLCDQAEIDQRLDNAEGRTLIQERRKIMAELKSKNKELDQMTDALRSVQWETGALMN